MSGSSHDDAGHDDAGHDYAGHDYAGHDYAGHDYAGLDPDTVLAAVETLGSYSDGRLLALNSYENRVYQVGMEDAEPLIAKFYRPGRWSDAQIHEEHAFSFELAEAEIPVVAPLVFDGKTLFEHAGYRFAVFPRRGGRPPELDDVNHLEQLGRFFGRIHMVGAARPFVHRPALNIDNFGVESATYLLENGWLPREIKASYRAISSELLDAIREKYATAADIETLRLHGDAHPGNILWRDDAPHFVDLDDCRTGPAIQDLWMFLSGDRHYRNARLMDLLIGYTEFREFDPRELHLVEALRALRMMHYAAWLARRWDDPAFPLAFPWFNTARYWDDHILELKEQLSALDEPSLVWD
ncbi:MAG: serine/threonine protein kinase [Chromatiales bacterium]|nr:serine/threonine protein kinase [Chromatiales bacterium]